MFRLFSFRPKTGSMDAWNAAYVRVEDYLRAHRIHNRLHQSRLIQEILERAARRHEANPALDPTTLAADETGRRDGRLVRDAAGREEPSTRIESQWPADSHSCSLMVRRSGPTRSSIAARSRRTLRARCGKAPSRPVRIWRCPAWCQEEIDLGPISEAVGETLERIEKWPMVRTLLLWAVFVATLTGIFRATR